jgi:membrane-associated HD superfamily phosphohydrolase
LLPRESNVSRVVAGIGALFVIASLFLPWLTINFIGQFNFSLLDFYNLMARSASSSAGFNSTTPQLGSSLGSVSALLVAVVFYPIAAVLSLASIASRKAILPAGICAVISGLAWTVGVQSLLPSLAQAFVSVGYGAYVVILGGIVVVIGHFIKPNGGQSVPTTTHGPVVIALSD